MDFLHAIIELLSQVAANPLQYSLVFFVYSVATTLFLPLPVLVGLFLSPATPFVIKALAMSAGKATGSLLIFFLGSEVDRLVRIPTNRPWLRRIVDLLESFVARTRYWGLFLILSIPGMSDSIPLYLFALFNRKGVMKISYFVLVSFFSGMTRAFLVLLIVEAFGIVVF